MDASLLSAVSGFPIKKSQLLKTFQLKPKRPSSPTPEAFAFPAILTSQGQIQPGGDVLYVQPPDTHVLITTV